MTVPPKYEAVVAYEALVELDAYDDDNTTPPKYDAVVANDADVELEA